MAYYARPRSHATLHAAGRAYMRARMVTSGSFQRAAGQASMRDYALFGRSLRAALCCWRPAG